MVKVTLVKIHGIRFVAVLRTEPRGLDLLLE